MPLFDPNSPPLTGNGPTTYQRAGGRLASDNGPCLVYAPSAGGCCLSCGFTEQAHVAATCQQMSDTDRAYARVLERKVAAQADAHRQAVTAEDLTQAQEAVQGIAGSAGSYSQARAPGKMFSRSDILAILRAQRVVAGPVVLAEYDRLLSIFSNIE